jgi:selenocysteine-specific elongation factor
LTGKRLEAVLSELLSRGTIVQAVREPRVFLGRNAFAELKGLILKELADYLVNNPLKEGIGKEELKSRMPKRSDQRFFGPVLSALEKEGKALAARDLVKIAGEKKAGTGDGGALKGRLEAALVTGGIEPPTVKELCESTGAKEKEVLDLLHLLVREGKGVKVKADLFYAPAPLSQLRDKLTEWLKGKGEIVPGEFRELTGLSRKFMIPVLEYFDHEKVTIRVGDKRMLRRA